MNLGTTISPSAPLPVPRRRKWWLFPGPVVWFVLVISLAGAIGGWFIAHEHALLEARKRFDEEAGRVTAALTERMQIYEDVLHGAVGLYAASYSVERGEWRAYLESVSIERRFPGIDGVGFLAFVPRAGLSEFLQITRADKTPDFAIQEPLQEPGATNDLMVVKYIEPEERHRGLLGRNLALDPEWRAVTERARNTGLAALSGKVTLRDAARQPRPGCVMLLPVYRRGAARDTVVVRQTGIEGWVFARFITEQLMQGVLGRDHPRLHLQITDSDATGTNRLVFDSDSALSARSRDGRQLFSSTIPARFGGRSWLLHFSTKPAFEAAGRGGSSLWVGAVGGLISVLLFGIAWSLSHTRLRALALAADMTQTLRTTNERLQSEIHERERAESAMRLAKEAAEEANRTKSQFLASMSHELRTPLNSVIGFANIMLKNKAGNLSPADLNFLDRIQANGKHLLGLINEVLDLSKIEARKVELQTSPVQLDLLVRETVAQQEGLVRDKPVRLLADLPSPVAPLTTDADKLRQVLINLIGNALKFTDQGTVTVRVVVDRADHRPTQLQVVDTGIGIPPDKLGIIFEAFQQAEAGTARKYGGTGLGLTISQALCQLMGYHIEVSSELGHGSTFSVCFAPQANTPPQAARVAATETTGPASSAGNRRVLIVDDEEDSRRLLVASLENRAGEIRTADSAPQASQIMKAFSPGLVLLDLVMPGTDGLAFLAQLRSDPRFTHLPVAIVTARELTSEESEQLRYLAQDIVKKGATFEADLSRVLQRFLRDGQRETKDGKA